MLDIMIWFLFACVSSAIAGTVSIGIEHKHEGISKISRGNTLFQNLVKRNTNGPSYYSEPLSNDFYAYYATIHIGSNRQPVNIQIDTGSSDLLVMSSRNVYCNDNSACNNMQFNPEESETFTNTSIPWDIKYLDKTGAFGFLAQDTIEVAGASVKNAYFTLADISNVTMDIFGIGFAAGEGTVSWNPDGSQSGYSYPNYPMSLKSEGLINTVAYSLYLNSPTATQGSILFGGVDHAKYTGELSIVPMVNVLYPYVNKIFHFTVMLHGISVLSSGITCPLATNIGYPVVLDSGSSFAILPARSVFALSKLYNYTWNGDDGYFEGQCTSFRYDAIGLDFSGINLTVPLESLIVPSGRSNCTCMLAIQPSEDITQFLLGDIFLRNFYVVYDLENYQVALAQAKFTEDSEIEEIKSTVPKAISAPSYFSTQFINRIITHDVGSCISLPSASATSVSNMSISIPVVTSWDSQVLSYSGSTTVQLTHTTDTANSSQSASGSYYSTVYQSSSTNSPSHNRYIPSQTEIGTGVSSVISTYAYASMENSNTTSYFITTSSLLSFATKSTGLVSRTKSLTSNDTSVNSLPSRTYVMSGSMSTSFSSEEIKYNITSSNMITMADCNHTKVPISIPTVGDILPSKNNTSLQSELVMGDGKETQAWTNQATIPLSINRISRTNIQPSETPPNTAVTTKDNSSTDNATSLPIDFSNAMVSPFASLSTSFGDTLASINQGFNDSTPITGMSTASGYTFSTNRPPMNSSSAAANGQYSLIQTNDTPSRRTVGRVLVWMVISFCVFI